jgi:hypothetical protein
MIVEQRCQLPSNRTRKFLARLHGNKTVVIWAWRSLSLMGRQGRPIVRIAGIACVCIWMLWTCIRTTQSMHTERWADLKPREATRRRPIREGENLQHEREWGSKIHEASSSISRDAGDGREVASDVVDYPATAASAAFVDAPKSDADLNDLPATLPPPSDAKLEAALAIGGTVRAVTLRSRSNPLSKPHRRLHTAERLIFSLRKAGGNGVQAVHATGGANLIQEQRVGGRQQEPAMIPAPPVLSLASRSSMDTAPFVSSMLAHQPLVTDSRVHVGSKAENDAGTLPSPVLSGANSAKGGPPGIPRESSSFVAVESHFPRRNEERLPSLSLLHRLVGGEMPRQIQLSSKSALERR